MTTENEEAFAGKLATGMELGAVVNGNLRFNVDLADGTLVRMELPHRWLNGPGGLSAFIRDCCKGPHKASDTWCLDCGEHHDGSCEAQSVQEAGQ